MARELLATVEVAMAADRSGADDHQTGLQMAGPSTSTIAQTIASHDAE